MSDFDKMAAGRFKNLTGNAREQVKNYTGHLSGRNVEKARNAVADAEVDLNVFKGKHGPEGPRFGKGKEDFDKGLSQRQGLINERLLLQEQAETSRKNALLGTGAGAGVAASTGGAYALGKHNGKEREQEAFYSLMDSLEKTAAGGFKNFTENAVKRVNNFGRNVSGRNLQTAQNRARLSGKEDKILHKRFTDSANQDSATRENLFTQSQRAAQSARQEAENLNKVQQATSRDRKIAAGAGAGVAAGTGVAGGAYAINKRNRDEEREQVAFDSLMDGLEKTAAGGFKNAVKRVKNFGGNVSGRNLSEAEARHLQAQTDFNNLHESVGGASLNDRISAVNKVMDESSALKTVQQATSRDRKIAAGAGVAAGTGVAGGAYAINKRNRDEEREQVAFYSLMDSLEKTAAGRFKELAENASGRVKAFGKSVSGQDLKAAKKQSLYKENNKTILDKLYAESDGKTPEERANLFLQAQRAGYAAKQETENVNKVRQATRRDQKITAGAGAGVAASAGGAYALSKRNSGEEREQEAFYSLMDNLEKTAAGGFKNLPGDILGRAKDMGNNLGGKIRDFAKDTSENVKNFPGNVSGRNLKDAEARHLQAQHGLKTLQETLDDLSLDEMVSQLGASSNKVINEGNILKAVQDATIRDRNLAIGAGIGGGVGVAAGAGGGYTLGKRHSGEEREQEAFYSLMDSLEKTAAGGFKNFVGNVSGRNAKKAGQATADAEAHLEKYKAQFGSRGPTILPFKREMKNRENALEASQKAEGKAKESRKNARLITGIGAGAVAGGGAAGAGGVHAIKNRNRDEEEKTASEDFMSEMYKEAAAQIIEVTFPSVKEEIDPIHKISFSR